MSNDDSMLELYFFENQQLLENLESLMLSGEKGEALSQGDVDEVFRIMHTIKGASSMMSFDNLFHITHSAEDLFSLIRDNNGACNDWRKVFDVVLDTIDFVKKEFAKIQAGQANDGDPEYLIDRIGNIIEAMSEKSSTKVPNNSSSAKFAGRSDSSSAHPCYKIKVFFEPDCKMENIRALGLVSSLGKLCSKLEHIPGDLDDGSSSDQIIQNGFTIFVKSEENPDSLKKLIESTLFVENFSLIPIEYDNDELPESMRAGVFSARENEKNKDSDSSHKIIAKQNFISVNVNKLDSLMDLVGEMVTTESMVTRSPDLAGLHLSNFEAAANQLKNLTSNLQSIVMSMRLLPVSTIFFKMQRIARDTSKKINKDIDLVLIGEETEVDKNIIDGLSDPLMHLIRNSIDHGIESAEERVKKGKPAQGRVTLEAKNTGEDVMITVSDDGRGLDCKSIIQEKGTHHQTGKRNH